MTDFQERPPATAEDLNRIYGLALELDPGAESEAGSRLEQFNESFKGLNAVMTVVEANEGLKVLGNYDLLDEATDLLLGSWLEGNGALISRMVGINGHPDSGAQHRFSRMELDDMQRVAHDGLGIFENEAGGE